MACCSSERERIACRRASTQLQVVIAMIINNMHERQRRYITALCPQAGLLHTRMAVSICMWGQRDG